MAAIQVAVGGITFNGAAAGNGSVWTCDFPEGWEGAPLRQSFHDKLGAHGQVIGESNMNARTIGLSGTCKATSQANAWSDFNTIVSVYEVAVTSPYYFYVYEPAATKSLIVYSADRPRIKWISPTTFQFQLEFIAPNPVKV